MSREKLDIRTPSEREIAIVRDFDAPRELVFRAWTTPQFLRRWFGVFGAWTMTVCELELRVGGAYRYEWRGSGGRQMVLRGIYREVAPPERLVFTEHFGDNESGSLNTVTLVERAGKTTATITILCDSRDKRDRVLQSGMETGLMAGYEKLDEIFASGAAH